MRAARAAHARAARVLRVATAVASGGDGGATSRARALRPDPSAHGAHAGTTPRGETRIDAGVPSPAAGRAPAVASVSARRSAETRACSEIDAGACSSAVTRRAEWRSRRCACAASMCRTCADRRPAAQAAAEQRRELIWSLANATAAVGRSMRSASCDARSVSSRRRACSRAQLAASRRLPQAPSPSRRLSGVSLRTLAMSAEGAGEAPLARRRAAGGRGGATPAGEAVRPARMAASAALSMCCCACITERRQAHAPRALRRTCARDAPPSAHAHTPRARSVAPAGIVAGAMRRAPRRLPVRRTRAARAATAGGARVRRRMQVRGMPGATASARAAAAEQLLANAAPLAAASSAAAVPNCARSSASTPLLCSSCGTGGRARRRACRCARRSITATPAGVGRLCTAARRRARRAAAACTRRAPAAARGSLPALSSTAASGSIAGAWPPSACDARPSHSAASSSSDARPSASCARARQGSRRSSRPDAPPPAVTISAAAPSFAASTRSGAAAAASGGVAAPKRASARRLRLALSVPSASHAS